MTRIPRFGVIFLLFFICVLNSFASSSKIHPWVLEQTRDGQEIEFFIILAEQGDVSAAYNMPRKTDRGRYVYNTLWEIAQRTQAPLKQWLESRKIEYRSFYIVNALLVKGNRELIETLAARPDVARIEGNPTIRNVLPSQEPAWNEPQGVEWNIDRTNAPDLWALGYTGQGIVVGGQDTGYRWTHNALKSKYRGWNGTTANHDYNWHDSIHSGGGICGANSPEPCDDYFHGTHTMGTVLGDAGLGNQIGMAPGAKWIGCRNMDMGNGTPATYLECFEFFLAPYPVGGTPDQGDPAMAPDVTVNSWGCPPSEGCSDSTLEAAVNAQKAAGIMFVAAAGNAGSACDTVDDPPALYDATYTVGSTTSSNTMSGFSSRGEADYTNLIKPDIVAPGSNVRSATNSCDSCYSIASGTSMATPHVAGAIALLWSSPLNLANQIDSTKNVLNASATRLTSIVEGCGGDYVNGPNNTWGYGLLDVLAAYNAACTPPSVPANLIATVNGEQIDLSWDPVSGASYDVYRGTGPCAGANLTFLNSTNSTTYTDVSTKGGVTYSYFVRAIVSGCSSLFSNCDDAMIPCNYSIDPSSQNFTAAGGTGQISITATTGCGWTAVSNDPWISIVSGGSGAGNGMTTYSVAANPNGASRTGSITVAGQTFTVTQDAAACTYSINPLQQSFPASGGSDTITVSATPACGWTAVSNDSWITVTGGSTGTGNGSVDYTVDPNAARTLRTGTITVAGLTFTVNQDAACLFCDDFEDGVLPAWNYLKPGWTETGGNLVGTPTGSKAIAVATPVFSGCVNCIISTYLQTEGGTGNRVWLLGWYVDKKNTMELLMKQETGKFVLKQRVNGTILARASAPFALIPGVSYHVELSFDGTQFALSVDSTRILTLTPAATVPAGTVGYKVRNTTGTFAEIAVN